MGRPTARPYRRPRQSEAIRGNRGSKTWNLCAASGASGSYILLQHLLEKQGINPASLEMLATPARSEHDVALSVADGKADVGFGIAAVARQNRLGFVPIFQERYDLAIWRRDYFEPPLQAVLAFSKTAQFAERAKELGPVRRVGLWNRPDERRLNLFCAVPQDELLNFTC